MTKKSKKASKNKQTKSSSSKTYLPIKILGLIVIAIGGYFLYGNFTTRVYPTDTDKITSANVEILKGGETRPTLSPARFVGKTAGAYKIAKESRELLDSIYCYCNCKKNIGHKSLLSCYVDKHAVNCSICQDQAFYAYSRYQKGDDIAQVRVAVDKRFWRPLR